MEYDDNALSLATYPHRLDGAVSISFRKLQLLREIYSFADEALHCVMSEEKSWKLTETEYLGTSEIMAMIRKPKRQLFVILRTIYAKFVALA